MSFAKLKAEFDAWIESEREFLEERGLYPESMLAAYQMLLAWQASRTALAVDLPAAEAWLNDGRLDREKDATADECVALAPLSEVRAALVEAGVAVVVRVLDASD